MVQPWAAFDLGPEGVGLQRSFFLARMREGMMERTREIAQTLKAKGFSDEEIMGITGLSVSDLDTL